MKRTFLVLALAIGMGTAPYSHALTKVPREYPKQNADKPAQSSDLPATVAVYKNDVILVASSPDNHEIKSKKLTVDPAVLKAIQEKAGSPLTLEGLVAALQQFIRENPNAAIPAAAAAFALAQSANLPGNPESSLVVAAIQALDGKTASYTDDVATLIGFAVESASPENQSNVLRQLRSLSIAQNATGQVDFTFSLDQALALYNIVEAKSGGEEVLVALNDFLPPGQGDDDEDLADLTNVQNETMDIKFDMSVIETVGFSNSGDGANLTSATDASTLSGTSPNPSPINGNPASQTEPGTTPEEPPASS